VNKRWIEGAMGEGGTIEVGARVAHEWSHKLAADHAREIKGRDLRALLGADRASAVLKRLRQFSPTKLRQVGTAVEVWSQDRLIEGPLNYQLSEFTADLWRFVVWKRDSGRQGLEEKARNILNSGYREDDTTGLLPASSRGVDVSIRRLMALMYASSLNEISTQVTLTRVTENPGRFLEDAPPEISRLTHRATIRALRGEMPVHEALTGLTAWKGTQKSVAIQDVCRFVRSTLGL
jgi:hypothetical protein